MAKTSGLGMVRAKGNLCRTRKGHFTKCRKPISRGKGKGFSRKHARGIKGRCVKWSKGKTRCVKRARPGLGYKRRAKRGKGTNQFPFAKAAGRGRCLKWSKGRTRCIKRAAA